jgi:hypothetical protein
MESVETYSDGTNRIIITIADDGVTVDAKITTKPPYTGGASADAAREYARKHGLKKL